MTSAEGQYLGNHRRQTALVFVISFLGLLLSIAPRQERALFITDGQGLKAFAAEFAPIHPATLLTFPYAFAPRSGPLAFFARAPRPAGPPVFTPAQPGAAPFAGAPAAPAAEPGGSPFAQPAAASPATGPFTPAQFGNPSASPVAPVTPGTPTPAAPPSPAATPTPVPVMATPEPAAWMMMLAGFALVGAALRRRPVLLPGARFPSRAG